jgi:hypothetical protein
MNAVALLLPWRRVVTELQPIWRCRCGNWEPRYERAVNASPPTCEFCCHICPPGQCDSPESRWHRKTKTRGHKPVPMTEAVRRTDADS